MLKSPKKSPLCHRMSAAVDPLAFGSRPVAHETVGLEYGILLLLFEHDIARARESESLDRSGAVRAKPYAASARDWAVTFYIM